MTGVSESRPTDADGFTHSAGGVAFREADTGLEFALVKSHTGNWVLPKGGIEPDETALEAAVREIAEETGLRTEVTEHLGDVRYQFRASGETVNKVVNHYLARVVGGSLAYDPKEHCACAWFCFDEAVRVARFPNEVNIIARAGEALRRHTAAAHVTGRSRFRSRS